MFVKRSCKRSRWSYTCALSERPCVPIRATAHSICQPRLWVSSPRLNSLHPQNGLRPEDVPIARSPVRLLALQMSKMLPCSASLHFDRSPLGQSSSYWTLVDHPFRPPVSVSFFLINFLHLQYYSPPARRLQQPAATLQFPTSADALAPIADHPHTAALPVLTTRLSPQNSTMCLDCYWPLLWIIDVYINPPKGLM
ncbi:hypothetical protein BC827DRAFT_633793 [Russula dissimulans]|nr:hypothetical protein BC827DRAFT_633793 [Russula dissimulans]